ncbi:hypothetical protein AB0O47_39170, partial [Streptomyces noursei]|uniref:hypothetical protein n=1 Tax=Streptomyces noursei TaxID=1971 RepID=UPI00344F5AF8
MRDSRPAGTKAVTGTDLGADPRPPVRGGRGGHGMGGDLAVDGEVAAPTVAAARPTPHRVAGPRRAVAR